ncbi:uncharacterized protein isoform X2 [Rhodnius prolixus]|uniref:uncharacterized protein isoform X2 n=1 Tax=Rhodnius prolixus TaxID=13249 RepID=UPI003D1888B8
MCNLKCQILLMVEIYSNQEKDLVGSKNDKKGARLNYWFESKVSEPDRGFSQYRSEMRKGDTVNGQYEYSDGYMRVRVDYIADRAGYRVIKEERIPMETLNETSHHHQGSKQHENTKKISI